MILKKRTFLNISSMIMKFRNIDQDSLYLKYRNCYKSMSLSLHTETFTIFKCLANNYS